jgi:hypothetical protein
VFLKNNYGEISDSVILEYRNGLFMPVDGTQNMDAAARLVQAEEVFLALLKRFNASERNVNANPGPSYAPSLFAKEPEATKAMLTKDALAAAMRNLLATHQIMHKDYGRPSRPNMRLVINPQPGVEPL